MTENKTFHTVVEILDYIHKHNALLGFPPTAIGLPYGEYIEVVREMGGDGRCTNLKARLGGVLLVDTSA